MEQVALVVKQRAKTGKSVCRRERREGLIPGVVYGKSISPVAVSVPGKLFNTLIETKGHNVIVNLEVTGGEGKNVYTSIVKELQRDPVTDVISHLDFVNVDLTEEMETRVPIRFVGEAEGIKQGGIFEPLLRELEVLCLPSDIPQFIELNVSALTIGHSLHVEDIPVPEKVKILTPKQETVVTVSAPAAEEEVVVATPETLAEPEVIRAKKEEKPEEEPEVKAKEKKL